MPTVTDNVTDRIQTMLEENAQSRTDAQLDTHVLAQRIANVCAAYYEASPNLMEVMGTVKRWNVDGDCTKEIAVTVNVLNMQENRVALAMMGADPVTLRMTQAVMVEAVG